MLLVAEHDMVEERTVRWQKFDCNFERFGVPKLGLLGLYVNVELFEETKFFFKLNDESEFG